ncbi:MAG: NYN domain-containing protein [Deltaproteobacteria bacterium]|nr:NYN domain-containing protein [Deltaproteobacteria bacterium]
MSESVPNLKLAVLIDADNASPDTLGPILTDVARHGTAYVRRIYGNWASSNLSGWRTLVHEHALTPMQQFAVTAGKNATDSALIIDAMDLLYTGRFGGFCIVSSDSDFSRLASRLRESGLRVFGYGRAQTPISFRRACDEFIDVALLARTAVAATGPHTAVARAKSTDAKPARAARASKAAADSSAAGPEAGSETTKAPRGSRRTKPAAVAADGNGPLEAATVPADPAGDDGAAERPRVAASALLSAALGNLDADQDGYVQLSELSTMVRRLDPEFDVRAYGTNQFIKLVRMQPGLELQTRDVGGRPLHFVRAIDADETDSDASTH